MLSKLRNSTFIHALTKLSRRQKYCFRQDLFALSYFKITTTEFLQLLSRHAYRQPQLRSAITKVFGAHLARIHQHLRTWTANKLNRSEKYQQTTPFLSDFSGPTFKYQCKRIRTITVPRFNVQYFLSNSTVIGTIPYTFATTGLLRCAHNHGKTIICIASFWVCDFKLCAVLSYLSNLSHYPFPIHSLGNCCF